VGAGFIGAEVAGSARALGREVTVVEALPNPLERAVGREAGVACASLHAENGTELLLEPMGYDFARTYQKALYDAGIPCTTFASQDVQAEYDRLKARGVVFRAEPTRMEGMPTIAVFEDTCGNLVQMFEAS